MATKLGSNSGVVAFGHRLLANHAGALIGEVPILATEGLKVPRLDPMQSNAVASFAFLNGNDFDRAFVDFMVEDHEEDIAVFEAEAHNGQDILARDYAVQSLPVLRDHLRIALRLQQQLEGGGSGSGLGAVLREARRTLPPPEDRNVGARVVVLSGGVSSSDYGVISLAQSGLVNGASGSAVVGVVSFGQEVSGFRVLVHFAVPDDNVLGRLRSDLAL